MAEQGLTDRDNYANIADAIRQMNGRADEKYKPEEMAREIMMIEPITGPSGGISFSFDDVQLELTASYNYKSSPGDYFTYASGVLTINDLVTITIDGVSLSASTGMDWESWCNSSYNIYTELVPGYRVYCDSEDYVVVGPIDTDDGAVTLKRNDQYGTLQRPWIYVTATNTLEFVTNYVAPESEEET